MGTSKPVSFADKRAAMLKARADRNATTYPVELPDASLDLGEPLIAQVRRFEVGEYAVYFGASDALAKRIAARTPDYANAITAHDVPIGDDGTVSETKAGAYLLTLVNDPAFQEMCDLACLACMVEPRLVETEEERASDPEAWLLTDLTRGDRQKIFFGAQAAGKEEQAATLETFQQESASDVADHPAVRDSEVTE